MAKVRFLSSITTMWAKVTGQHVLMLAVLPLWRRCPDSHSVGALWPEPWSEDLQQLALGGGTTEHLKMVAAWNIKERFLGKDTRCART